MIGFIYGGEPRRTCFNYENLRHFDKEHKEAFGPQSEVDDRGYPDNGSGRYSTKMSYREWFDFNSN